MNRGIQAAFIAAVFFGVAVQVIAESANFSVADKTRGYNADFFSVTGPATVTFAAADLSVITRAHVTVKDPQWPGWITLYDGPPQASLQVKYMGTPLLLELFWSGPLPNGQGTVSWSERPVLKPVGGRPSTTLTYSCSEKENIEKGCCCFKPEHTYAFPSQAVESVKVTFDTGRGLGCESVVKFQAETERGWVVLHATAAVSSKGRDEKAPVTLEIPVDMSIQGFRLGDEGACCIDYSEIELKTPASARPVTPQSGKPSLGTVWDEMENGWTGVWTRRGASDAFDAVWTKQGEGKVSCVLAVAVTGPKVTVQRRNCNIAADADYEGTLETDGKTITGTGKLLRGGAAFHWLATIRK